MTTAVTAATIAIPITANTLGFIRVFVVMRNPLVVLGEGCALSTVVGAVARFIFAAAVCARLSVLTLLDDDDPSWTVPASLSIDDESLTSVAPSTRQNFSASSISTRWHWGQRFILGRVY